jgi:replicative DNA helicase
MNNQTPKNLKAEVALIGSILLRPKCIVDVIDKVTEESFYDERHKTIYKAIKDTFLSGKTVDSISLGDSLRADGKLQEVGGITYLSQIVNSVPSSTNVEYYAETVSTEEKRRKLLDISMAMEYSAYDKAQDVDEIISSTVTQITGVLGNAEDTTFKTAIKDVYNKAEDFKNNPSQLFGISTGISELDYMLDGFQEGQFIGFAAYTSQGKTWDAVNIAAHQLKCGRKFCIFSLEMSAAQIAIRLCGVLTGIKTDNIRKGLLTDEEKVEVDKTMKLIENSGSTIYGNQKLSSIKVSILKEGITNKPDLFILDYLQLISEGGRSSYDILSDASHYFQNALMKSGIPMFALSQISNDSAKDGSANLLPFKGSGDIGASLSTAIYKRSKHKVKKEVGERLKRGIPLESEWVVQKNRDGDTVGTIDVWFDNKTKRNYGRKEFEEEYGFDRYNSEVSKMNIELDEGDDNQPFGSFNIKS